MANLLWLQGGACSGNTMSFVYSLENSFLFKKVLTEITFIRTTVL